MADRKKMYYRMGEVCELTGLESHVLRFWETEFSRLKPKKNRSGHRTFTKTDIDLILKIKRLLHEEGFTIAGAIKKLDEDDTTINTPEPLIKKKLLRSEVNEVKIIIKNVLNILDRE